ncbi:MAG: hypothetical protein LBI33_12355 [Propionibacteriaceae bacterium]|nr:hypothetical protein [Propionibacteriaceae bacterium]
MTAVVRLAWTFGARTVWLHTSTGDHPPALASYLARGFQRYLPPLPLA